MNPAAIEKLMETSLPTRKSVRQLRWFETSFRAQMDAISAQTGQHYALSEQRLVETFLSWHRAFDTQKPASRMVRRAYVSFAAGMMFSELLQKRPVTVLKGPVSPDGKTPAHTQPEVYLYASYCHVIRQAILGQDFWLNPSTPDRLDDLAIWQTFSWNIAQDKTAAVAFLDLFANESQTWAIPKMTHSEGGFGKRLWDLAARQSDADAPTGSDISKRPALRAISNSAELGKVPIPLSTSLVLVAFEGVAVQSETIDSEELSALLQEYGVPLTPQETQNHFFCQPHLSVLAYIAEHTKKPCSDAVLEQLDERLIQRDQVDLALTPGIAAFLDRLKKAGLQTALVSHGRARRVAAAQNLPALSALKSTGGIHLLDGENGLQSVAQALGHAPENTLLIDASSIGVAMAKHLSMPTYGFVGQKRITDRATLVCAGAQAIVTDLNDLTLGG